jgi:hypothetical protein
MIQSFRSAAQRATSDHCLSGERVEVSAVVVATDKYGGEDAA